MNNDTPPVQTLEEMAFEKNVQEFQQAVNELSEKYGVVIVPKLRTTPDGIMPAILYQDKRSFDAQKEELLKNINKMG